MKNEYSIREKIAYRAGLVLRAESAILRKGRGNFVALKQHFPSILMCCVEELAQSLVLGRVELPQVERPLLTQEDPADEHDLDYVDKLEFLVHHILDIGLESGQLSRTTPGQALLFPGGEPRGDSGSELGGRCPFGVTRLNDVEPPRLPPLYGLPVGALEPCGVGHLAHHGASALRLLAAHHFQFDIKILQP